MKWCFTFIVCVIYFTSVSQCERLHGQIYSSIEGSAACFRRLNGTHQMGCSSSDGGAVGVVHMIKDIEDAQWIVKNSSAGPYAAVVSTYLFESVINVLIEDPRNVAGVLLYDNATIRPSSFSQESQCPNEYSSSAGSTCSAETPWNTKGTGLLRKDIPFPIFFVPNSKADEIEKIEKCYNRYNLDRNNQVGNPLCSLQLHSFMYAAVNTAVCLRRSASSAFLTPTKVCDPLGDYNVYASLFPRTQDKGMEKPVTLVTARIDSASLFDGVAPGAASSVVGMVTLISTAATLSKMIPVTDAKLYPNNILWTLFNGESFDYIGSQRVAYDISRGSWPPLSPLSLSDIKLHVEIGQLGGALGSYKDATWPLYAFTGSGDVIPQEITEFLVEMTQAGNPNMTISPVLTANLPPSSLHSFRRILNTTDIPELLLVDHKDSFTNMFYESALDLSDGIDYKYHNISVGSDGQFIPTSELLVNGNMTEDEPQVKISRVANALAKTLYQRVTGKPFAGVIDTSAHLVDEMLHCFLQAQSCRLLHAADFMSSDENTANRVAPLYVGVATWASPPAVYAGHLLAILTGQHLDVNKTVCDGLNEPGYSHYYLRGWNNSGICIQTTMNFSQAVSPAFIKADYDFSSNEFSTWTESVWQTMWARVFVTAGGAGAKLAAIAGAFATLISSILTYWITINSAIIFMTSPILQDIPNPVLRTVNC